MDTLVANIALLHGWIIIVGQEESIADKLHSILAQLDFSMVVKQWEQQGIMFSQHQHLYVQEIHPITGKRLCEMEEEGHVFKVSSVIGTLVFRINTGWKGRSVRKEWEMRGEQGRWKRKAVIHVWLKLVLLKNRYKSPSGEVRLERFVEALQDDDLRESSLFKT